MEEDILINVEAKYKSLDDLAQRLELLKKQFKGISKVGIDEGLKKSLNSATDVVVEATKQLDVAQKNVLKIQDKLREAKVAGDTAQISKLKGALSQAEERLKVVVKTIKQNPRVKKETAKAEEELNNQQELRFKRMLAEKMAGYAREEYERESNFRALLAEQVQRYDQQEMQRKQQLYEQQKKVADLFAKAQYELNLKNAQNSLAEFELSLDPTKKKLVELQSQLEQARQQFIKLNYDGQDTKGAEVAIKRLTKQIENTKKATKKTSSSWEILINRIKNISIYRMIRTGLHWITSGFQEGINNLVQYDDSANKTMSNLNASLTQIKNTMGIAFASVLQSLEPIITTVADSLVDLVNSFNVAMAKMQGKNVYTKAKKNVDDYAKSLKSAKKLSFDTFEVLSGDGGKTQPFEMFEEESVKEGTNATSKTFEKLLEIGKSLFSILTKIWKNIIEPAMPTLLGIAKILLTIIGTIVTIIDKLNLIYPIIFAIIALKVTSSIRSLIGSFKSLGEIFVSVKTWFQNYNLQCSLAKTKTDILKASALSLGIALVSITGAIVSLVANWDKMSVNAKNWVIAIATLTAALSSLAFAFYAASGQCARRTGIGQAGYADCTGRTD